MNRRGISLFLSILLLVGHTPTSRAFDPFTIGATFGPQAAQGAVVVLGLIAEKTVEIATAIAGYWGLSAIHKRWLGKKAATALVTATEVKVATTVVVTAATNSSSSTSSQPTNVNNPIPTTPITASHPPIANITNSNPVTTPSQPAAPTAPKTFKNPIPKIVDGFVTEGNRIQNGTTSRAQDALLNDFKSALKAGDTRTATTLHDLAKAKGFNTSHVNAMASDLRNVSPAPSTPNISTPSLINARPAAPITPQGPVTPPTMPTPVAAPQPAVVLTPAPAPSVPSSIDWGDPAPTGGKSFARDIVETAMAYKALQELKAQNNEPQKQHPLAAPSTTPANPEPEKPEDDKEKKDKLGKLASTQTTEELKQKIAQEARQAAQKANNNGWNMSKTGSTINGRYYSRHALERMAPKSKEVIEELEKRAFELGYSRGTQKFTDYVQPRNIPPSVVEDAINSGLKAAGNKLQTWSYTSANVKVITNDLGHVMTVYPI